MIDSISGAGFLLLYNIAEARVMKRSGGWVGVGMPVDAGFSAFGFRVQGFRSYGVQDFSLGFKCFGFGV